MKKLRIYKEKKSTNTWF